MIDGLIIPVNIGELILSLSIKMCIRDSIYAEHRHKIIALKNKAYLSSSEYGEGFVF